ncbi:MobH family relaxase [Rheinheimera hassiensis]|uniref:MobH family relaxase n=1 Tax=Rheinheimera hassiensis TaxID=1193627 RepID=UPI001F06A2D3|nr:MobH family relaxase [Rheinheimera hassiensis]
MILKILGYLRLSRPNTPATDNEDRDIYGRVIDDAEVYFYPRPVKGLPLLGQGTIRRKYKAKLQELKQRIPIGDHHLTPSGSRVIDELYWNVIDRLIEYVHMIPASEDHHHSGPGGLFYHSVEASLYAMRAAIVKKFETTGMIDLDREMEPRARYAAWLGGLVHDLGKVLGDITVDAVTVFDKYNSIVNAEHNEVPAWKPDKWSIFDWAKEHKVVTYSVSYRKDRRHNRHNVDTVLMLRQIVGDGYAMDYLTDGPVNLHRELGRVLSNYESSKDYLSICVREGDVLSTAKDMAVYTRPSTGSAQLSTPSRIYRALKASRPEWEWNQRGKEGWIVGGRVHVKWPTAIESIIKGAITHNIGIPHNAKTVVSIMEENGMLSRFEPSHLTIKFSPGNFSNGEANMVLRGEKSLHWEELLRFAWNGTVFDTDPLPDNARGLIFLSESAKMFIADDKGGIIPVVLEPATAKQLNLPALHEVEPPENAAVIQQAEPVQDAQPKERGASTAETNEKKPAAKSSQTKAKVVKAKQQSAVSPNNSEAKPIDQETAKADTQKPKAEAVVIELEIDTSEVSSATVKAKTKGVNFAAAKQKPVTKEAAAGAEKSQSNKAEPSSEPKLKTDKPAEPKPKATGGSVDSGISKSATAKPSIQSLIDASVAVIKVDGSAYAKITVSELDRAFSNNRKAIISQLKHEKMLHVDAQNPTQLIHTDNRNGLNVEVIRLKTLALKMFPEHLIATEMSADAGASISPLEILANNLVRGSIAEILLQIPMEKLKLATSFADGKFAYRAQQMAIELKRHTAININDLYKHFTAAGHKPEKTTLNDTVYESVQVAALNEVIND